MEDSLQYDFIIDEKDGFEAIKICFDIIKSLNSQNKYDKYIFRGIRRAKDHGIRSGAAIRLEKTYGENYTFIDYINYHRHLIEDAKNKFPSNYNNKHDLEILAEIQHNGGATCLVDFSNNFLTALWFACNKSTEKNAIDNDGIVYCMNLNDALVNNRIMSIISKYDENKSIEELLKSTRRFADFEGKYKFKFWYWFPEKYNNRMTNQDSIFIFGMEKFDIQKNNVITIRIKENSKQPILDVMEQYFNMSITTIYPDINGYSDANNKFNKISITGWEGSDCMSEGTYNMLYKNNSLAIDYFDKLACCIENNMKEKSKCPHKTDYCKNSFFTKAELYYLRAETFKHDQHPNRAIINYRNLRSIYKDKIQTLSKRLKNDSSNKMIERVKQRVYSSYSQELLLLYKTKRFTEALDLCEDIINKYKDEKYNINYARISQIELTILIYGNLNNDDKSKQNNGYYKKCKEHIIQYKSLIGDGKYYSILLDFFDYFAEIYFGRIQDYEIDNYTKDLMIKANQIKEEEKDLICDWYLDDIKNLVDAPEPAHLNLFLLTAKFNEIQALLKMKFLNRKNQATNLNK